MTQIKIGILASGFALFACGWAARGLFWHG